MSIRSVVAGYGYYLPEKVVTNQDLEKEIDTNDEWIQSRTGIKQRHIIDGSQFTSDLATNAANSALSNAEISAEDIDLIILATTTPDNTFPSTAAQVQATIGAKNAAAFDVQAVCAGFVYALSVAEKFISSGSHKNVLVIGAEALSRIVDWSDRNTCVLFGDGAGALVLRAEENTDRGILSTNIHTDGSLKEILFVNGGPGSGVENGKIVMQGKEVFKHAISKLASSTVEALEDAGINKDDVDWVVPHQANIRIMEGVTKKLEISNDKLISTVSMHANTSAASIPLAICAAAEEGKLKEGDTIAVQAIGGGLSWGACVLKW